MTCNIFGVISLNQPDTFPSIGKLFISLFIFTIRGWLGKTSPACIQKPEPMHYKKYAIKSASIPYGLVFRRYWKDLAGIAFTWFIWDFIM